jgi:hypothetical protein
MADLLADSPIVLFALVAAVVYLGSCAVHPYRACKACKRSKESHSTLFKGAFGACRHATAEAITCGSERESLVGNSDTPLFGYLHCFASSPACTGWWYSNSKRCPPLMSMDTSTGRSLSV